MNVNTKRAGLIIATEIMFAGSFMLGGLFRSGPAEADEQHPVITRDTYVDSAGNLWRDVVLLHDLPGAPELPGCAVEDCSDQPGGIGLWMDPDTGNWFYTTPDRSYLVIDE